MSTGNRRRRTGTYSKSMRKGSSQSKGNVRYADIPTVNRDGEVAQEVVGPGGTGVRCTHVTPLSLATDRGHTLTGQKGIVWKGVSEHASIEYAGSAPVIWRRIVFASVLACRDAAMNVSDDQAEECQRPPMVASNDLSGKAFLRLLFLNPSRSDVVHATPDVEGVRVLKDEKFTYGNASGFIKERKLWNNLGKVTYAKATGNSCHNWSAPDSPNHNIYVMDILRCGFPTAGVKLEGMDTDGKSGQLNLCAAPSAATQGVALDGVRILSSRFRVYWHESLA